MRLNADNATNVDHETFEEVGNVPMKNRTENQDANDKTLRVCSANPLAYSPKNSAVG